MAPVGIFHWAGNDRVIDGFAAQSGAATGKGIALLLEYSLPAFYVLYGLFARKGAKWAFIAGMIFYALDAVLLLLSKTRLSVAFHAYALFRIFQGFQAAQRLGLLRAQQAAYPAGAYAPPPSTPSSDVWPPPPNV